MKTRPKHLFYLRLFAGLIFLVFGVLHIIHPENFRNILLASKTPFVDFNVVFAPLVEVVVGILFLIGLYTRIAATLGCVTMAVAFGATYIIIHLASGDLPTGMTEKPFSPPLFIPVIIFLLCLYLLIMGSGPWGLDRWNKKNKSKK